MLKSTFKPGTDSFDKALLEIAAMFPTLTWVPNMAQRRIIAPWEKPPYPFMVISSCGNGVGKTDSLPQDIVGCLCGPEYLNDCWNYDDNGKAVGMIHYQYYHDVKKLRESGTFCYRLLCGPDDMKENGSLYTAIKHYIPTAKFKGKMSTGCYKQIEIPLPHNPQVKNYIDIKTFDQEVVAQAGANLHRIGINEPPPFPVWNETVARIRSKKGSVQCTILMNATILDQATWVFSLEEDPFLGGKFFMCRELFGRMSLERKLLTISRMSVNVGLVTGLIKTSLVNTSLMDTLPGNRLKSRYTPLRRLIRTRWKVEYGEQIPRSLDQSLRNSARLSISDRPE